MRHEQSCQIDQQVSVRFPVVAGGSGAIATLTLEVIPDGTGTVYPDPDHHATTVRDDDFDSAIDNARTAAGFPCGDEDSPVDVRWRIAPGPTNAGCKDLSGGSAGGAFAVGLLLLKRGRGVCRTEWLDSYVVMAGVDGDGRLTRVYAQDRKLQAVREAATGSGQDIRCLVVAEASEDIEIDGVRVVSAATVRDVLRLANTLIIDGEPEPQFASEIILCHDSVINDGCGEDSLFFHPTGAVMERRDLGGSPPFLFPEVTGFAVQDLVFMFRTTGKEEFLDKARRAAKWLTTEATREEDASTHRGASAEEGWCLTRDYIGGIPEGRSGEDWARSYSFESRNVFRFDNAIVLIGLIDLYEETHDRQLLTKIRKLASNFCRAIGPNGEIDAVHNLDGAPVPQVPGDTGADDHALADEADEREHEENSPEDSAVRWSRRAGPYLVRVAEALARVARMEMESTRPGHANTELAERCLSQARKLCAWVMAKQHRNDSDDGRFPTHGESTHLHPQLYAVEGLMECGMMFARHSSDVDESAAASSEECLEAAVRGARWALRQVSRGQVPREVGPDGNPITWAQRTDVVAQLLYVGSRLYQAERFTDQEFEALADLAHAVLDMRHARRGYYRFGEHSNGQSTETPSYWTEFYAVKGLLHYARAWLGRKTALIVLAGGVGTKSWPVACEAAPKSLTTSLIGESLLAATVRRCIQTGCIRPSSIYVVCRERDSAIARKQASVYGVPESNIVAEHEEDTPPSQAEIVQSECGTIQALESGLNRVREDHEFVWLSYSDGLFSPIEGFAEAAHRAIMTACCDDEIVVSLGMEADRRDPRYGHTAVNTNAELAVPGVYPAIGFFEKPAEARFEELSTAADDVDGGIAWESGNLVAARDYWRSLISDHYYTTGTTISLDMLESSDVDVKMAVAPYVSSVRWADIGLSADIIGYFAGSLRDRGEGNVSLNPNPPVSFFKASGNLVISDGRAVDVVGVSNHLIIDCSRSGIALVVPMTELSEENDDALDTIRSSVRKDLQLVPFLSGDEDLGEPSSHTRTHDVQNCSNVSEVGLLLMAACENLKVKRTSDRLTVCWRPFEDVMKPLMHVQEGSHPALSTVRTRCEDDPLIVRHLLDVWFIAKMVFENTTGVPPNAEPNAMPLDPADFTEVLTLVTLCHDLGGVLDRDKVRLERKILELFSEESNLNWPSSLPGPVLEKMIIPLLEHRQRFRDMDRAKVLEVLDNMDDDTKSALAALEIEHIAQHRWRDAIIWTVANQEYPRSIGDVRNELDMPHTQLAHLFACLKVADCICYGQTLWKPRVREDPHDLAGCLTFIADFLKPRIDSVTCAGFHMEYIDTVNRCLNANANHGDDVSGDDITLLRYIETQLRYREGDDGKPEPVPLYCSDRMYLRLLEAAIEQNPIDVTDLVEEELEKLENDLGDDDWSGRRDELILLSQLPERLRHLGEGGAKTVLANHKVLERAIIRTLPDEAWDVIDD